jgi:2-polyprenyl-3-methyl-5-hydroxy-6-metoxy-1,4-benzoquinol methylase
MANNTYFVKRIACPACESKEFKTIYSIPYNDPIIKDYLNEFYGSQGKIELEYVDDAEYVLRECSACKLIFQEYIPNDFLMNKLYEEWIDPNIALKGQKEHDLGYYRKLSIEIYNIIAYFNRKPDDLNFLNFGMGWGEWNLMVNAYGSSSSGMELSQERINHAKKHALKIIDWDEVPSNQFDFINTEQVFEHIPNPLETLQYLMLSLKPNGLIKISVPNGNVAKRNLRIMDWSAPKRTRNSLNIVAPLEHINCFRSNTIKHMARLCGLQQEFVPFRKLSIRELIKANVKPFYYQLYMGGREDTYLFFKKIS